MSEQEVSFSNGERYFYLEECPFCGSDNNEFRVTLQRGIHQRIQGYCLGCGCYGPLVIGNGDGEHYEIVVDNWNKRR